MKKMNTMGSFRVQRMTYLLIPLCRGLKGDSSGRGGVENGGLWRPELTLEAVGKLAVTLQTTMDVASAFA